MHCYQAFRPHVQVFGATPALERAVRQLTRTVLFLERAPHGVQLDLDFVRPHQMQRINRQSRGQNRSTDVLTFSNATAEASAVNELLFGYCVSDDTTRSCGGDLIRSSPLPSCAADGEGSANHRGDDLRLGLSPLSTSHAIEARDELLDLGVIYVCVEYMWWRCQTRPSSNLPFFEYLHAALVHATLHALGYDHDTPQELRRMVRREQALGRQLQTWKRRFPLTLPPLDGLEYLRRYSERQGCFRSNSVVRTDART